MTFDGQPTKTVPGVGAYNSSTQMVYYLTPDKQYVGDLAQLLLSVDKKRYVSDALIHAKS